MGMDMVTGISTNVRGSAPGGRAAGAAGRAAEVDAEGELNTARRRPPWGRLMRGWGRRGQVEDRATFLYQTFD